MPRHPSDRSLLTSRELDVLQHAASGLSNRDIGERLGIAEQTVKNHLSKAMRKLALHDRMQAVVVAIGNGWIGLPVVGASVPGEGAGMGEGLPTADGPELAPGATGQPRTR